MRLGGIEAFLQGPLGDISISSVTAADGSALTAGYLEKRQLTKRFCPVRSEPDLLWELAV
ncbi:hypothetical protein EMIT0P100_80203 [Pseudomonas sp. IT-P100]